MPYSSVREIELIETGSLGKEVLSNDAFINLERGISGTATIVLSNADYTLSATEGQAFVLILTGTVTDDVALIVPQESRVYVVDNRCTIVGTHSITMRPPVGGGVTVETGYQRALMYCDGSNVYPVASGTAAGGGAGAPTDATYLVGSAHALLSGERVVTDTATITWDLGTPGQARAMIPPDAISYTHIQNVSSSRILGRFTGGAGDVQEITPGTGLTLDAGTGVLSATAVGQPLDATLTALAGLTSGANLLPYFTGVDTVTTTTLSAFVRTILDDADAATVRGTIAAQASDATLTALAGVSTGADTLPFFTGVDTASTTTLTAFMRGLLDDPDAATARSTLGVTGGGGSSDFLGLSDTPESYTGQAGKVVLVNAGATALEFATASGATAVPFRGCVLKRSTLATGINASTLYTVLWDSEDYDTDTLHSTGTNPARITVPSGVTRVQVSAGLRLSNVGSTTGVAIYIRKNGTTNVSSAVHGAMGYTDAGSSLISPVLSVIAGDYFEVMLLCSDTSIDIQADADNYFACEVVEPYAVGGGATTWLGLTDTPDTYTGQAGKVVQVNAGATATEYGPVLGSMAQQDASNVAITGGSATFTGIMQGQYAYVPNRSGDNAVAYLSDIQEAGGTNRWFLLHQGNAPSLLGGSLQVAGAIGIGAAPINFYPLGLHFDKTIHRGMLFQALGSDTGYENMYFQNVAGVPVGAITTTATTTTYLTTSDVRLKHAITALTGALDRIRALRPVSFLWNADGSPGDGFLAHELMQHIPAAVTGVPDAVNEDGSVRPQGVDHSKIVPHLTAALQELATQVQTLTARVATLEATLA